MQAHVIKSEEALEDMDPMMDLEDGDLSDETSDESMRNSTIKRSWNPEEDQMLLNLVWVLRGRIAISTHHSWL